LKMLVEIRTVTGFNMNLNVMPDDTSGAVKSRIQQQIGVNPDNLRLFFNGIELNDATNISRYRIQGGDIIQMIVMQGPAQNAPMEIRVRSTLGLNLTLTVLPEETVLDVKNKIQEQIGTPSCQQTLSFLGRTLEDGKTLRNYAVRAGSTLEVDVTPLRAAASARTASFHQVPNENYPMSAFPEAGRAPYRRDPFSSAPTESSRRDPDPFSPAPIQSSRRAPAPVGPFSSVARTPAQTTPAPVDPFTPGRMQSQSRPRPKAKPEIRVNIKRGAKTFPLYDVLPNELVDSIKELISVKEGVPPEDIRLLFHGTILERGTLADYDVQNDDTIIMVVRPPRQ